MNLKNSVLQGLYSNLQQASSTFREDFSLQSLRYLPRWIVLFIDIAVVMIASVISYFLLDGLGIQFRLALDKDKFIYVVSVYLSVTVFFFWLFRTYSGIIRHSTFIDGIRLFFAQSSTFLVMFFINVYFEQAIGDKLFLNTRLLLNIIISFMGLFLYRIVVKQIFEHYLTESKKIKLERALIYGTGFNATALANALRTERPQRFKLLGFVDYDASNTTKRILDMPIYTSRKKVPVLLRSLGANTLILASNDLQEDRKIELIDECLEYGFKVYTVPVVADWSDVKDISKKVKSIQIEDLLERKPIKLDNTAIQREINGKTVVITGAAGSIGGEIVNQVIAFAPKRVVLIDQAETPLYHLTLELSKKKSVATIHSFVADIRNKKEIESIFSKYKPDIVFHAAAYKHVPMMEDHPIQAVFTNVMGTRNLADLSVAYKVEKFVMISTDKAVNPSNVMGASKRIAEKYVQTLNYHLHDNGVKHTKFITTRFGNVLGSNGSVVPLFKQQIANGGPITITHPKIIRYFMTIPEACQLVLEAGAMGSGGEIYIFDMGKPVKIIDLARKMIRMAGLQPDKDIKIEFVGLRPGEKLYEELLNDSSKTLPTHHEKIMIAVEVSDTFEMISEAVDLLINITEEGQELSDIVMQMKSIVPEFRSMNSSFSTLDIN